MVVPSFAALLSDSPGEGSRDGAPVLRAVVIDHMPQDVVLVLGPRTFRDKRGILQFKPSIKTLDL